MIVCRWLWYLLVSLVFFAVVTSFLIGTTLWLKPGWLINKQTVSWAQSQFFPEYKIPWDQLELKVEKVQPQTYSIQLEGHHFCQELGPYGSACFDEFILDIEVVSNLRELKEIRLNKIVVKDKIIRAKIPPSQQNQDEDQDLHIDQLIKEARGYLTSFQLAEHQVELDNTTVEKDNLKLNIYLSFINHEAKLTIDEKSQLNVHLDFKIRSETDFVYFQSELQSPFGTAKLSNGVFDWAETHLSSLLSFQPLDKKIKETLQSFRMDIDLRLKREQILLDLKSIKANLSLSLIKNAFVPQCSLTAMINLNEDIELNCQDISFHLDMNKINLDQWKAHKKELPESVRFDFLASLPSEWLKSSPQSSSEPLSIEVNGQPIEKSLFQLRFSGRADVMYEKNQWQLKKPSVLILLSAPQFQKLVQYLKDGPFAIPAPFHVLKGPLQFEVKELPNHTEQELKLPFSFSSNLTSERNVIEAQAKGEFTYPLQNKNKDPQLDIDIQLSRFYFQLPPFDPIRGFPPLSRDSRISTDLKLKDSNKEKSALQLNLKLKTKREDSIRIYYDLIRPFASFGANFQMKAQGTQFKVQKASAPFRVTYLNRSVIVQNLSVTKKEKSDQILVDGQILYPASDYKVYISFSGPIDKPEVVMTSDPPLDRRDIISVLLYNRVNSEIASFEQQSVGGTEAALADRAVGLFGIWAFASTPIEAVSYNPVTGTYSAQVKLPEGFRFSIGTNWESVQNLELRRRLGGNWFVSTIYRPQTDEDTDSGEVMIQRRVSY